MTLDDFRRLFAYSDNCRQVLHETLQDMPTELIWHTFSTTSRFDSIAAIWAHCLAAEERWITHRLQALPLPVRYEERAAPTLAGLFADADMIRRQTYDYLNKCQDSDLARVWHISFGPEYAPVSLSLADVLFHVLNHENYHRGQIVLRLQSAGFNPPNFDFIFLRAPDRGLSAPA